jgi:hypothetical protein
MTFGSGLTSLLYISGSEGVPFLYDHGDITWADSHELHDALGNTETRNERRPTARRIAQSKCLGIGVIITKHFIPIQGLFGARIDALDAVGERNNGPAWKNAEA